MWKYLRMVSQFLFSASDFTLGKSVTVKLVVKGIEAPKTNWLPPTETIFEATPRIPKEG